MSKIIWGPWQDPNFSRPNLGDYVQLDLTTWPEGVSALEEGTVIEVDSGGCKLAPTVLTNAFITVVILWRLGRLPEYQQISKKKKATK
jgi:hypothetical protein